ncbi:MAG TPA: hypothetical protein VMS56_05260 [Thermoanaerobaculia bacterium]|nr:hypothetical protein [Thermoanaerobaculia bacterium]
MTARVSIIALFALIACVTPRPSDTTMPETTPDLDTIARSYVRLVLSMGLHDPDYVDAYYGPPEWRSQVEADRPPLNEIRARAAALVAELGRARPPEGAPDLIRLRHGYLATQLEALIARADILLGRKMSFDEQAEALYDAAPPRHSEAEFREILERLDDRLPGEGPLPERVERFRRRFMIPADRLDRVFRAAIDGCRARTVARIALPPSETFRLEYVTGKSWSGYNWYQGGYQSLIQVNTELPIFIDRAIDLACHEGYPGHHVYNVLLEKNLVRDRGWPEYSVYALFSPQSLIAEGTANFGIEAAFPADERLRFEKETLFPLAGLDPGTAEDYYEVLDLLDDLSYAGNEAARRYMNGEADAGQTAAWLSEFALYSPERARQRVRFIDQYGAYVINYNLGKDLVRRHVEALGGTPDRPERRWEVFEELLSTPRLPSNLAR